MKPLRQRHNQVIEQVQADANIMAASYQKAIAVMEAHIAHLKTQLAQPRVGCLECDFTGLLDVGQVDVVTETGEIVQRPYRVLCPACRPMLTKFIDDYLCWMQRGSDASYLTTHTLPTKHFWRRNGRIFPIVKIKSRS